MRTIEGKWNLSAINLDYKFIRPVNKRDQRNATGKRNVGW
jgi:hypothetical protein